MDNASILKYLTDGHVSVTVHRYFQVQQKINRFYFEYQVKKYQKCQISSCQNFALTIIAHIFA